MKFCDRKFHVPDPSTVRLESALAHNIAVRLKCYVCGSERRHFTYIEDYEAEALSRLLPAGVSSLPAEAVERYALWSAAEELEGGVYDEKWICCEPCYVGPENYTADLPY